VGGEGRGVRVRWISKLLISIHSSVLEVREYFGTARSQFQ
jgi:hypothetical protein